MHSSFDACPEFASDDRDDLAAYYAEQVKPAPVAPAPGSGLHPMIRTMTAQFRRFAGIGDPAAVGGTGLDMGFLLACAEQAPDVFGDLVAWRGGSSVADLHARGKAAPVADDQVAAARARRHREYCDGLRVRPLSEVG